MDKFVVISKPSSLRVSNSEKDKKRAQSRFTPYNKTAVGKREDVKVAAKPSINPSTMSTAALTKHILSTLSEESNPVTHSTIPERADYVTSTITGHEVSDGHRTQDRRGYLKERAVKLANQLDKPEATSSEQESKVLRNTRIHINGFLDDTTDIEMKRIVTLAGGEIVRIPSNATHILTSQQLSGSKTHKMLTRKSRNLVHVVKPEWVTDSIAEGRRQPERNYSVLKPASTMNISEMLQK